MTKKNKADQLISRRDTLRLLGAVGATGLVGLDGRALKGGTALARVEEPKDLNTMTGVLRTPLYSAKPVDVVEIDQLSCVAKTALTEGPFFVDEKLNRSDIRADPSTGAIKAGASLKMKFYVGRISSSACSPLSGAWVDLWHCDAFGAYSDVNGQGNPDTRGQQFLRGYQITDSNGVAEFQTIYPGYYTGRTTHMHYKVRTFSGTTKTYEFTSQVVFDDTLTDQVYTTAPYNTKSARGTRNSNDNIAQSGGSGIILNVTSDGAGGYTSTFSLGLSGVPNTITSISTSSAASFATDALAPEAIAAIFGTGLATSTVAATTSSLPTTLGGIQVQVTDALGTTRNAPLFFVSASQINFQIPAGTSTGTATLTVLRDGTAVGQGTAAITSVGPGLFTANADGKGVPAAVLLRIKADGTQSFEAVAQLDSATNKFVATPIDLGASTDQLFLVAFGSGIRNRSALSAVACTIGGTATSVLFAGSQGSLIGVDQINALLPRSLAGRGNVDVTLSVDGKAANTVTVSIK